MTSILTDLQNNVIGYAQDHLPTLNAHMSQFEQGTLTKAQFIREFGETLRQLAEDWYLDPASTQVIEDLAEDA